MTDLALVLDEHHPPRFVGLHEVCLGTVRQQLVVKRLKQRLDPSQSVRDGAGGKVQAQQSPVGKLPLDRYVTIEFSQQQFDKNRHAQSSFGDQFRWRRRNECARAGAVACALNTLPTNQPTMGLHTDFQ